MIENDLEFYFIDSSKFRITEFTYRDFDVIIKKFGFEKEKNINLHTYFSWSNIEIDSFDYELLTNVQLKEIFNDSKAFKEEISYYIRLKHRIPIIEIKSIDLLGMMEDLVYETGMGWEAISTCGKYIIEFTDGYIHQVKLNFIVNHIFK